MAAAWQPFGTSFAADWPPFENIADQCLVVIRGIICRCMAAIQCCPWLTRQYPLLRSGHHSGVSLVVDLLQFNIISCSNFAAILDCHLPLPGWILEISLVAAWQSFGNVTCSFLVAIRARPWPLLGHDSGTSLAGAWPRFGPLLAAAWPTSWCLAICLEHSWSLHGRHPLASLADVWPAFETVTDQYLATIFERPWPLPGRNLVAALTASCLRF